MQYFVSNKIISHLICSFKIIKVSRLFENPDSCLFLKISNYPKTDYPKSYEFNNTKTGKYKIFFIDMQQINFLKIWI